MLKKNHIVFIPQHKLSPEKKLITLFKSQKNMIPQISQNNKYQVAIKS